MTTDIGPGTPYDDAPSEGSAMTDLVCRLSTTQQQALAYLADLSWGVSPNSHLTWKGLARRELIVENQEPDGHFWKLTADGWAVARDLDAKVQAKATGRGTTEGGTVTVGEPEVWCGWSYKLAGLCPGHGSGEPGHSEYPSQLGPGDEPQGAGVPVAVWFGDYRYQEVWVSSSAGGGTWCCLGGEFGRPRTWIDQRSAAAKMVHTGPEPGPGRGQIREHPRWEDIVRRGPVTLLTGAPTELYRQGWINGRKALADQIAELAED